MPSFANNLRSLLESLGISSAELARRLGVPAMTVSRWMTGRRKFPRIDTVEKIAAALGVDHSMLLGGGHGITESLPSDKKLAIAELVEASVDLNREEFDYVLRVIRERKILRAIAGDTNDQPSQTENNRHGTKGRTDRNRV